MKSAGIPSTDFLGREAFATRRMIRRSHDGDDSAELAGNTHLPWTLNTPLVTPEEFLTALPWTSCTVHELSGRRMLRHCTKVPDCADLGSSTARFRCVRLPDPGAAC